MKIGKRGVGDINHEKFFRQGLGFYVKTLKRSQEFIFSDDSFNTVLFTGLALTQDD